MVSPRAGACLLLGLGAGLVAGSARGQAGPPCVAEARVSPARAVVGQQLVYAVRVLRRPDVSNADWIVPPSFPSFRAEWLPGRPGDTRLWQDGTPYLVYEERHALFPVRAGHLALPGARLLCELHALEGEERRGVEVDVAGAVVEVGEPPLEGRPASFGGLVGRLRVRRELEPRRIRLGESLRLRVVLEGAANLWDAPTPPLAGLERADLFARRPELALDAASVLRVRRTFVWDVVPRRAGHLELPGFEVASFDADEGRYALVEVPPLGAEVEAAAAPRATPPAASAPPTLEPTRLPWRVLATLLLVGAAGVAVGRGLRARRRRPPATVRAVERALEEAEVARARGARAAEEAALARALRGGLALHVPGAQALAPEELAAATRGDVARAALALLVTLDAARFAPDGPPPDAAAVRRVVLELLRDGGATRRA